MARSASLQLLQRIIRANLESTFSGSSGSQLLLEAAQASQHASLRSLCSLVHVQSPSNRHYADVRLGERILHSISVVGFQLLKLPDYASCMIHVCIIHYLLLSDRMELYSTSLLCITVRLRIQPQLEASGAGTWQQSTLHTSAALQQVSLLEPYTQASRVSVCETYPAH